MEETATPKKSARNAMTTKTPKREYWTVEFFKRVDAGETR